MEDLFVTAKALLLALSFVGVAATGVAAVAVDEPLGEAIDIHKDHLGQNSTMPDQSTKGQQNALDHLTENLERWLSKPHNDTDDQNDTDDDQNETDDDMDDIDDDELNETDDDDLDDVDDDQDETDEDDLDEDEDDDGETNDNVLSEAVAGVLNWIRTIF